jgi:hypothetical protein
MLIGKWAPIRIASIFNIFGNWQLRIDFGFISIIPFLSHLSRLVQTEQPALEEVLRLNHMSFLS